LSYNVVYQDIGLRDYKETWDYQEGIFKSLVDSKLQYQQGAVPDNDTSPGTLIFVEHPHVYTLGKNGSENNLLLDYIQLQAKDATFYRIDRGGDITYHGPGQIVGYPIFDLEKIKISLKEYIHLLEEAVIITIEGFGLTGSRLEGATGVWLDPCIPGKTRKICAIGVRASRYVTMHGFAFNINTDLTYFNYINPCGFTDKGVTSIERELGNMQDFDAIKLKLKNNLQKVFDLKWINK
jgi:lipoyl(octanoyl) transferase